MKQVVQNLSTGETSLSDVPCPQARAGSLLIATRRSLISPGTERMLVEFGRAGWLEKARQQPDKVRAVLQRVRTDGLLPTLEAVRSKLDQPLSLGYSNAGVVLESGVEGFAAGDRVVSNGQHAEVVRVPKNLCARIPEGLDDDAAAFTVLGAIGLQGIRLVRPTLGEAVAVTGLGLIGLLAVQMLRAHGCRVLGIDPNPARCELARGFGAEVVDLSRGEDPLARAALFSRGRGLDAVLITAATKSDEPMHQAATMCRKRGRIVLTGVVGLRLSRDDFFKKELTFQVSGSYGPGRYDPDYEERGHDYPIGFVRWTEQRNFEAVLDLLASGALDVRPLVSHRFAFDCAVEAYGLLDDPAALGILLEYPERSPAELRQSSVGLSPVGLAPSASPAEPVVGVIGAGNYASRTLIPALREAGARLETVVTDKGVSAAHHGMKAGFRTAATDTDALWSERSINAVVIATRHDQHARQVIQALEAGKNVFVEKPLAIDLEQLEAVDATYRRAAAGSSPPRLMVGFNRRFAPHVIKMKELLAARAEPKTVIITVNAGEVPADHWTQDPRIGGGRIIGEGCHFFDLMRHLVGHPVISSHTEKIGAASDGRTDDKASIHLGFADGSFGCVHYLAHGSKAFPKERVEVFCGGSVLQLTNFRELRGYGWAPFRRQVLWTQDKGQRACVRAFVEALRSGSPSPIPYDEIMEVSRISIEVGVRLRA